MNQTSSDFVVKVSTRGVEEARRAIAGLEQSTSSVAAAQASSFSSAAASMEKMVSSAGLLSRVLDDVSSNMQDLGKSAAAFEKLASRPVVGNSALDVLSRYAKKAPATAAAVSRGNALDVLKSMPGAPVAAAPGVARGNALDVLRSNPGPAARTPSSFASRNPLFSAFGLGALQGAMPGQLGFVQRGPGAIAQILGMSLGNTAAQFGKAAFAGPGGIANAVGSLPIVGGALSGALSGYMQQADQVMSFQRQQVELAPLLGNRALDENLQPIGSSRNALAGPPLPRALDEKVRRARNAAAINSISRDASRLLGTDASGGQTFEASMVRGGAAVSDLNNRNYVRASMAAQTTLGVGADVTGAFGLGSRIGAFAGQKNADPAQMLLRAISQSNQLGLSGTEQQEYLSQIADGIRNIERTGIPFQMDTVRNLQSAFTGFSGISSRAAGRFAMGAQQRATDFMEQGPQSAFDMNVFRGQGFSGGLRSYYDTLEKIGSDPQSLAKGQIAELSRYARSPIQSKAIHDVRQMGQRLGIVDPSFAQTFVAQMSDPSKAAQAQQDLAAKLTALQATKQDPDAAKNLEGAAEAALPSSLRRQAAMSNATLAAGSDSVNVMLNASEVANKLGNEIGNFGGLLNSVSNALHSVGMSLLGGDSDTPGPNVRPAH